MREMWLPALEWYLSERVASKNAYDIEFARLDEDAKLERCDVGVFIDYGCMMQHGEAGRSPVEDALFRKALGSLDVVYAHRGAVTFLTTSLPEGVEDHGRPYSKRG